MATIGNTIRLTATFKNFAGVLTDVTGDAVTVRILQSTDPFDQIGSDITTGIVKVSTGVYRLDYTIPLDSPRSFIYEFSGDVEGSTELGRKKVSVTFI